MGGNAEQIGNALPLKWESAHNVVNQNYHIEHALTVGTIEDARSFQSRQVMPSPK